MAEMLVLPLAKFLPTFPTDLIDLSAIGDGHWIEPLLLETSPSVTVRAGLYLENDLTFGIPGVDAFSIVFKAIAPPQAVLFVLETDPKPIMTVSKVPATLRLAAELLRPAHRMPASGGQQRIEPDPGASPIELAFGGVSATLDFDGHMALESTANVSLPLCLIGGSGIAIEADGVKFFGRHDTPPPGRPAGWRGIVCQSARLYLPGDFGQALGVLELTDASIGNGGFSGTVNDQRSPPSTVNVFGLRLDIERITVHVVQNTLAEAGLSGKLTLPFFDEQIAVAIAIGLDGRIMIDTAEPLPTLEKPGLLRLNVESLSFMAEGGGFAVTLSGQLTPLLGGLDWPGFRIDALTIGSDGSVRIDGGWIDLPQHHALDFYGFRFEITRMGFGTQSDGQRWLGFSGGIHLVDGLPAGASVDGLRVTWGRGAPSISFEGIGVEFSVPGAFAFKGAVSYRELPDGTRRFDGAIRLDLISLGIELDGQLVVGSGPSGTFFAIYLDAELPVGFPLGPTGLGLYGLSGLFALQFEPDRHPDEAWYGPGLAEGWYNRSVRGVTDFGKWRPASSGMALGAGITIGTLPDNGFALSGKMLFAVIFPGPILLIEGRANILRPRAALSDDAMFHALALLDGRAGTFTFAVDAHYEIAGGGELIDIHGGFEAFFSFHDASAWHLYLGQRDPRERRIGADIFFHMFGANAYFMLDAKALAVGAWVGWEQHFRFGPVRLDLEAWEEGNAALSWMPQEFHGDLWLHGKVALSVFGFGFAMSVDACLAADVFTPFHIIGEFHLSVGLPWPLPDIDLDISLEWGKTDQPRPPLPLPLKEIAVEHMKSTAVWPLRRTATPPLLLPNYDDGNGFIGPDPVQPDQLPPFELLPAVPVDARLQLTFNRHVNDDALIGAVLQPEVWEQIGDPQKKVGPVQVRYGLKSLALHKWTGAGGGTWVSVSSSPGAPALYGAWAPMPAVPDDPAAPPGQVKLQLWAKSAFDYGRNTTGAWNDWFLWRFPDYPCPAPPVPKHLCCTFTDFLPGQMVSGAWPHPECPGVVFVWRATPTARIVGLATPLEGLTQALMVPGLGYETPLTIDLPEPVAEVEALVITAGRGIRMTGLRADGTTVAAGFGLWPSHPSVVLHGDGIVRVTLTGMSWYALLRLCFSVVPSASDAQDRAQHLRNELARWSQQADILEPFTTYRLTIETQVDDKVAPRTLTEHAYFRTAGPPTIGALSPPQPTTAGGTAGTGLEDLTRYVKQTTPITVIGPGERPVLPRGVYRAYDVNIQFNVPYVEMMYRQARRDLRLQIRDNNDQPARDKEGLPSSFSMSWGNAETTTLSETDKTWIEAVNRGTCAAIDRNAVVHDRALGSGSPGRLLEPSSIYQARLVPLLFHDDFTGDLAAWESVGLLGDTPAWAVRNHPDIAGIGAVVVGSVSSGAVLLLPGTADLSVLEAGAETIQLETDTATTTHRFQITAIDPVARLVTVFGNPSLPAASPWQIPATSAVVQTAIARSLLLHGDPAWTDYAIAGTVSGIRLAGFFLRFQSSDRCYRLTLGRTRIVLHRLYGGLQRVLAATDTRFGPDLSGDRPVVFEAIGSRLRVFVDNSQLFDVTDDTLASGQVGLYCENQARFKDIIVEDLRHDAPIAYRFSFTTSRFANFRHLIQTYDEECWRLGGAVDAAAANPPTTPPDDAEFRAFEALSTAVLGQAGNTPVKNVSVSRIEQNGQWLGFLLRAPEPIDWRRASATLLSRVEKDPPPQLRGPVKLIAAIPSTAEPNDEQIVLLPIDDADLGGAVLEWRRLPGTDTVPADISLFADRFDWTPGSEVALTDWAPPFDALGEFAISAVAGAVGGPPAWTLQGGALVEGSGIYAATGPATFILAPGQTWLDLEIHARMTVGFGGSGGIVLRRRDDANFLFLSFYRLFLPRMHIVGELVSVSGGVSHTLWSGGIVAASVIEVKLRASGARLVAAANDTLLFSVNDPAPVAGAAGLGGSNMQNGWHFYDLAVLGGGRMLGPWNVVDDGLIDSPSAWRIADKALWQSSAITSVGVDGPSGTYAVTGDPAWTDVMFSVLLQSDSGGSIGVVVRWVDLDNHIRLMLDSAPARRRLIQVAGGVATIVWQDASGYVPGRPVDVQLAAIGNFFTAWIDGVQVCDVYSKALHAGRVALAAAGNPGAVFWRAEVDFAQPAWRTYLSFPADMPVRGGLPVRLMAGNATQVVPQGDPGEVRIFLATGADPGRMNLPAEGADLRLTLARSAGLHQRRFRPDAGYAPVAIRVLRKTDGTALAIVPDGAAALPPANYRFAWTYRRNVGGTDPTLPRLTEAGFDGPETAQLDVPWVAADAS